MRFTIKYRCPVCQKEYREQTTRLPKRKSVIPKRCEDCVFKQMEEEKEEIRSAIVLGGNDEKSCSNCKFWGKEGENHRWYRTCLKGVLADIGGEEGHVPETYREDVCPQHEEEE